MGALLPRDYQVHIMRSIVKRLRNLVDDEKLPIALYDSDVIDHLEALKKCINTAIKESAIELLRTDGEIVDLEKENNIVNIKSAK